MSCDCEYKVRGVNRNICHDDHCVSYRCGLVTIVAITKRVLYDIKSEDLVEGVKRHPVRNGLHAIILVV